MQSRFSQISLALLILFGGLSFSFKSGNFFEITKNLELFATTLRELNTYYVDEIEPNKIIRTGINAMLGSLDPYTSFISEEDMAGYKLQTTGKYGGVGALIRKSGDYVIIADPYENFPANKSDLRSGDKIIEIDGQSLKGKNTDDVSKFLKGTPGTSVQVKIERMGESSPLEKTVVREEIKIKSVPIEDTLEENVGYIKLTNFTENCSKEVAKALESLKKEGTINSLILDLRNNPGGLLNEAVDVANLFIPRGIEVVSTKNKKRDREKSYVTSNQPVDINIPLTILIDNGSASASEIVAGVMQDLDRAVIIGDRSFGKGLVQTTKNVGYNSKVKLTTAKYYLPSGRCIQAVDYSGGYSDKLVKVPDSLRTSFKTKSGRQVYDAGGIDPDIQTENPELANIVYSLMNKEHLFNFATLYRSQNSKLLPPEQFELSDSDFEEFVSYLQDKDYEYVTRSESLIKELREVAKEEKYLDVIEKSIDNLEGKIESDKNQDVYKFKDQIKQLLEYEIVSRYYFQRGEIEESLEDDVSVLKALEVLKSKAKYMGLLDG